MSVFQDKRIITISVSIGILAGYYAYKRYRESKKYWNSEFVPAGIVKDLYLYPIKSGKGSSVRISFIIFRSNLILSGRLD